MEKLNRTPFEVHQKGMEALKPEAIIDWDKFQQIHNASLEILSNRGLHVGSEALVAIAKANGLRTEGKTVFFTEEEIEKGLAAAASSVNFTLLARNPVHNIPFNLDYSATGIGRSAPFIFDSKGMRRQATGADYNDCIKLGHILDVVEIQGNLVYPGDVPNENLFPFMMANQLLYSDKPCNVSAAPDIDILCMAFDTTRDVLKKSSGVSYAQSTVNCISPLILADDQGDFLIAMAEHGISISISPCPSAGMTGPCSVLGNVILNNCEVLSILVLTQLIRPGLPVFYGSFPCSCDMRSMSITYGGPESRLMESAAAIMGKCYGLLTRGNVAMNDAQACDFHAGAESMFCFLNALKSRINFLPGCGIMSSFAAASLEKLLLDSDLAAYARRFMEPLSTDDIGDLTTLIRNIDPKSNFVMSPHTFSNFKSALHHPSIFWRTNYDKWQARGKSLMEQASEKVTSLLAGYTLPPIDKALESRLRSISEG